MTPVSVTASRARYIKPSSSRFFATFGFVWLSISVFSGTLLVMLAPGASRGVLRLVSGGASTPRDALVLVALILFAIGTFMLSRAIVRSLFRRSPRARLIALCVLGVPAVLSLAAWSNPGRYLPVVVAKVKP
ncbi:MAG: hypothetical protein V4550_17920 [Gemmatimonadota bacterium]